MGAAEVAAAVSDLLRERGIAVVLVGGACVSVYSGNRYQSSDLDLVTYSELPNLTKARAEIGFRRDGRGFRRDDCEFVLDLVAPPFAVGQDLVDPDGGTRVIQTEAGTLRLLTPTDCVRDRLAAYDHWSNPQSLEQAVLVARAKATDIDLELIEHWSGREGHSKEYAVFLERLRA